MKSKNIAIGFATLALIISTNAFADEIYKWTDENGNVHYGDRPTGEESEERLQVTYSRTNAEALENRVTAQRDNETARREARTEAAEQKQAAEEERIAAEENQARCDASRAQLERVRQSERVYRTDPAGERVYLDEAQRAESIARSEAQIKENCST